MLLAFRQDHKEIIHPLVPKADSSEQVVGPDYAGKGLNFFIDGKKDGVDPGQFYKILGQGTWQKFTALKRCFSGSDILDMFSLF